MTLTSATPLGPSPAPSNLERSGLRRRTANVLGDGHCAPTVMKTLLDATGAEASWPVKLAAGLPGAIGNSRNVPLRCMCVVRRAPERCPEIDDRPCGEALSGEERAACALLHAHLVERSFHCAYAVLREARGAEAIEPALLDGTSAFVGGTAHAGLTCSALAAGVMLLGLEHGESEHRPGRILRAMVAMASGGHAFGGDLEAVNGAMNEGHQLATWFETQFGGTRCRDLTGADFSSLAGVRRYVESDGVSRCREVARAVATRVRGMTEGAT